MATPTPNSSSNFETRVQVAGSNNQETLEKLLKENGFWFEVWKDGEPMDQPEEEEFDGSEWPTNEDTNQE